MALTQSWGYLEHSYTAKVVIQRFDFGRGSSSAAQFSSVFLTDKQDWIRAFQCVTYAPQKVSSRTGMVLFNYKGFNANWRELSGTSHCPVPIKILSLMLYSFLFIAQIEHNDQSSPTPECQDPFRDIIRPLSATLPKWEIFDIYLYTEHRNTSAAVFTPNKP